jgi:hypothetical protein
MRNASVTKKPDTETHPDRVWLAEVKDGTTVIDAAYFPTKAAGEQWVRDVYKL